MRFQLTGRGRRLMMIFLSLIIVVSNLSAPAQSGRQTERKVRLVVGIAIDQFRYDYLERFADLYGEGGFRRLAQRGAVFTGANYIHTPTYTACGHATFMSGATPSANGIIGNDWYDRETGSRVTSVSDSSVKLLGGREGANGMSPSKLVGSTIGDELKLASNDRAKVIGLSLKDRSAILPAGKRPDGAYWFNSTTGNLVSSTYYFKDLPEWVKRFNTDQRPDRFFGKKWERLLPEASYGRSLPDDSTYERSSFGTKFPHIINGGEEKPGPKFYANFEQSPFANDYLVDFAKAAIENEKLGADDVPDLLTISFSSNDLVGHYFGPYSQEVEDISLRTDRALAELFNYLDGKIGLDQVLVVLTADHGVSPVPEQVKDMGYGGRVASSAITGAIETALNRKFSLENPEKWVLAFVNGNVYLNESVIEKHKLDAGEVEKAGCHALAKMAGVGACLTATQITTGQTPPTMVAKSVVNGFYAGRNGNMVIVPSPFYLVGDSVAASHGTPYSYDTHVPVILMGPGVAAGEYHNACSPADIAPTLATLLRIEKPSNSIGRVLAEALQR